MKLVKNNAPRLITLNQKVGDSIKKHRLIPAGKPVPVPDEVLKSRFAKTQILAGNISVIGESESVAEDPDGEQDGGDGADLEDLRSEAEALGIEVDGRWGEKRLRTEIDKALKA